MQRLRLLNRFFFQELGFAGNVNDYYDARNSYLHFVLQSRRGIPITLAVLYVEIASQIGLHANGVSFPGHFLVKLRMPQGEVVIDPFTGQSLSREALDALLVPYRRREGLPCNSSVSLALFLQAATPREILARMLRNLKEIHRSAEDWARLHSVSERLVTLLPDAWEERRDRGLAAAQLGAVKAAVADLSSYLENVPHAGDRFAINERLVELGHGDPSRLH
jgi:regulator of sirC expression with transglutaminase-like and TPR domain